ncbi:zinc-finger homeodomain protein 5-like isoform X3 [Brassica napus]|nr:zinc-finger homeodomain protein 5-like isoform X3 [Brassica napus]
MSLRSSSVPPARTGSYLVALILINSRRKMDMRSHEMIERRSDDNGNNDHHQSKSSSISAAAKTTVRYRECLKNHAANVGGSVQDGCGEFMPSGEEGTLEALRCAACDCHRNFHRKEVDGVGSSAHHPRHHHQYGGGGGRRPPPPNMMLNPLMLPPPPNYAQMHHHKYGVSPPSGMVTPMSVAYGGGGGAESSSEDLNMYGQSSGEHGGGATAGQMGFSKKRFRTKFTTEQKERMMEFAEKLGWRMNKQDEEELKRFCNEIGVKRQVFKVWMHNNKSNAKKPTTTTPGTL